MPRLLILFGCWVPGILWGVSPELLTQSQGDLAVTEPFKYTGLVQSQLGLGSGVVVQPFVYASAAHIFYNDTNQSWVSGSSIEIMPVHHKELSSWDSGIRTVGFFRWEHYADRSKAENLPEGMSSLDTFNMDFVAAYSFRNLLDGGDYSRTVVDEEEALGFLRTKREKTIIGYPAETPTIPFSDVGRMHWTSPGDYQFFWEGDGLIDGRDSDDLWYALYTVFDVETYGGNSGGPVFVRGDDDRWYVNGILVGGSEGGSLIRAVDRRAWDLVEAANEASRSHWLKRLTEVTATASDRAVELTWLDLSNEETGYRIERRDFGPFIAVGQVEAGVEEFLDPNVSPGRGYQYRVVPVDAQGNEAPASPPVLVQTTGGDRLLAQALEEPLLAFSTGGDASAFPLTTGGAQTGDIEAFETSFIELKVMGPGFLKYEWSVSSEVNPDYGKRMGRNQFDWRIYDAFYCYLDAVQQDFISGLGLEENNTIQLTTGLHTIRWEYQKDAYSDEGADAGILKRVEWIPFSTTAFVYGGIPIEGSSYDWASWFGYYTTSELPWTFHFELGWLYLSKASGHDLWTYSLIPEIGWIYIQPQLYPHVYSPVNGWMYYYEGSATFGKGQWFYLYATNEYLQL